MVDHISNAVQHTTTRNQDFYIFKLFNYIKHKSKDIPHQKQSLQIYLRQLHTAASMQDLTNTVGSWQTAEREQIFKTAFNLHPVTGGICYLPYIQSVAPDPTG